jgi:hypothetical protein
MYKYIYSDTNPNLIQFSTLILEIKFPQSLFDYGNQYSGCIKA